MAHANILGMGAPQPFKGSRQDWLDENGWRHDVAAAANGWELRVYPDVHQVRIAKATSQIVSAATVERTPDGWVVKGTQIAMPRHDPFPDPATAFAWFSSLKGADFRGAGE